MHHLFPLFKAASLLLLLAGFFGCATLHSVSSDLPYTVNQGIQGIKEFVSGKPEQAINADKYCDSPEEPSYEVTDNVVQIAKVAGFKGLEEWVNSRFKRAPTGNNDVEETVKTVSQNYVWMPVSFEQTLGKQLHARLEKDSQIVERKGKRNLKLYDKADAALKSAARDYTKLPYETKLYIIESDQINAEALPAGYIYLTRKAANDLDENALQLVLGHEMAHIAKRHTSKQIQQRLVDTGVATEMFRRITENGSTDVIDKLFTAERTIEKFNGQFAKYDQGQELQADACAVRGMLSAGADPLKAREEYLRKRGTQEEAKGASSKPSSSKLSSLAFTAHPDDKEREQSFRAAYQHHQRKNK